MRGSFIWENGAWRIVLGRTAATFCCSAAAPIIAESTIRPVWSAVFTSYLLVGDYRAAAMIRRYCGERRETWGQSSVLPRRHAPPHQSGFARNRVCRDSNMLSSGPAESREGSSKRPVRAGPRRDRWSQASDMTRLDPVAVRWL